MSKIEDFGVSEFFVQRPCGCERKAGSAASQSAPLLDTFGVKSIMRKHHYPFCKKISVNKKVFHNGFIQSGKLVFLLILLKIKVQFYRTDL